MRMNEIFESQQSGTQLDELSWKDIQRGAKKISKGAQKFTKNVADTGSAVGQAFKDVGGSVKQVGKTMVADPLAATYGAAKSGLGKAANVAANTYSDVKKGAQAVGRGVDTVATDVGAAGTWAGDKIKQAGRGVANVAGGAAGAVGATVGGATTGLGRAAAHGFNTGVQNVGGQAVDKMQTNIMKEPAATQQGWDDPKSANYVGRREVARRQAQSQTPVPTPATVSGYKSVTTAPPTVTAMKTAPVWTGRKPESKLTPAQYISRIGVDESLSWSKSFDPGAIIWKRMHESQ